MLGKPQTPIHIHGHGNKLNHIIFWPFSHEFLFVLYSFALSLLKYVNLLPMNPAVDLWSNISAMELL